MCVCVCVCVCVPCAHTSTCEIDGYTGSASISSAHCMASADHRLQHQICPVARTHTWLRWGSGGRFQGSGFNLELSTLWVWVVFTCSWLIEFIPVQYCKIDSARHVRRVCLLERRRRQRCRRRRRGRRGEGMREEESGTGLSGNRREQR